MRAGQRRREPEPDDFPVHDGCRVHGAKLHLRTEPVHEKFKGKTIWKGYVEVFGLAGHPKAKHCYGWTSGEPEEFITIMELPPVDSAQSAVKVGVSYQTKKGEKALITVSLSDHHIVQLFHAQSVFHSDINLEKGKILQVIRTVVVTWHLCSWMGWRRLHCKWRAAVWTRMSAKHDLPPANGTQIKWPTHMNHTVAFAVLSRWWRRWAMHVKRL